MGRFNELDTFCLIDEKGELDVKGMEAFVKKAKLSKFENSHTIVSIMGPQSSGKSTLLNNLFNTNFKEMDASKGRSKTTRGIWLAKCPTINPCTIVMDVEGSDGREREDDTAFEKMSALFAFAVSDIVIINIWCKDLGRVHGANKPLLDTTFEVMGKLFKYQKKTTLLFVLRDKTTTPEEKLESDLRGEIDKIWNSITKPDGEDSASLGKFFNVHFETLSNYEYQKDKFRDEVSRIKERLLGFISSGGSCGGGNGKIPASGLCLSIRDNWETIKKCKDLNLPAMKVMVAEVVCGQIVDKIFQSFKAKKIWDQNNVEACLTEYDNKVRYYDEGVRTEKRREMEDQLLQVMDTNVRCGEIANKNFKSFKTKKIWDQNNVETCLAKYDNEATYYDEGVRTEKRRELEAQLLQVMVTNVICGEIEEKKLESFKANKIWDQKKIETCLAEYDNEARYYDEDVRTEKRRELESQLLQMVVEEKHRRHMRVFATGAGVVATVGAVAAVTTAIVFTGSTAVAAITIGPGLNVVRSLAEFIYRQWN